MMGGVKRMGKSGLNRPTAPVPPDPVEDGFRQHKTGKAVEQAPIKKGSPPTPPAPTAASQLLHSWLRTRMSARLTCALSRHPGHVMTITRVPHCVTPPETRMCVPHCVTPSETHVCVPHCVTPPETRIRVPHCVTPPETRICVRGAPKCRLAWQPAQSRAKITKILKGTQPTAVLKGTQPIAFLKGTQPPAVLTGAQPPAVLTGAQPKSLCALKPLTLNP
eukprot:363585-Chlamydomonas_euryale.AAC.1